MIRVLLSLVLVISATASSSIHSHDDSLINGLVPSPADNNLFESHLVRAPFLHVRRSHPAHHSRPTEQGHHQASTKRFTRKARGRRGDARMRVKKLARQHRQQTPLIKILPLPGIKPSSDRVRAEQHREAVDSSWAWTDDSDDPEEADAYAKSNSGIGGTGDEDKQRKKERS